MTERPPVQTEAAPAGEHIHMPGPSLLPLLNSAGLACAIVGITEGTVVLASGLTLFLVTLVLWIRAAARETSELPLEHH
jgi:hypothetical protein